MFIFSKTFTVSRPKANSALIGLLLMITMILDRDTPRGEQIRKVILLHPVPPQSLAAKGFIPWFLEPAARPKKGRRPLLLEVGAAMMPHLEDIDHAQILRTSIHPAAHTTPESSLGYLTSLLAE